MQPPPRSPQMVPVLNDTGMPAFTIPWQLVPPQDALVIVVKGTYRLQPGEPAILADEQHLPTGEELYDGAETVRYPGDEAIFKPRADLFVGGSVYGGSEGYARAQVRFGGDVDVAFAAIGNRVWRAGRPTAPEPFGSVPLRPELAFGGPGHADNPWGRGLQTEDGQPLPNLERLDAPIAQTSDRPAPVLFGPLPKTHVTRARRLGTYDARWQRTRWPYFPDDFDWGVFNAAPMSLQIPYPRGDESYSFAGLHADHARIDGRLPELTPTAHVQRLASPELLEPVRLRLDTLYFTPDSLELVLVWRGVVDVRDAEASDLGAVMVSFEREREALVGSFEQLVRQRTLRGPEREPDAPALDPEPEAPPRGARPPRGLTPSLAASLGLPPWTATLPGPPPAPATEVPPPPAEPVARDEVRRRVQAGESLAGEDLSDADLTGICFDGCDLRRAILARTQLDGATFRGADLEGASLTEARGAGVVFRGASLTGAELSGVELAGADFEDSGLERASLSGANLEGASFSRARAAASSWMDAGLSHAVFRGTVLTRADLSGATLDHAVFEDANLEDARLYDVRAEALVVRRVSAPRLRADGAVLAESLWEELEAPDSSWRDADLHRATLTAADLQRAVFVAACLEGATLDRVDGREALFRLAKMQRASLRKANLMKACFESADLAEADLRSANVYGAETWKANLSGVRLDGALTAMSKLAP